MPLWLQARGLINLAFASQTIVNPPRVPYDIFFRWLIKELGCLKSYDAKESQCEKMCWGLDPSVFVREVGKSSAEGTGGLLIRRRVRSRSMW